MVGIGGADGGLARRLVVPPSGGVGLGGLTELKELTEMRLCRSEGVASVRWWPDRNGRGLTEMPIGR